MGRSERESSGIVRGLQAWGRDIPPALAISLGGLVAATLTLPACVGDAAPPDVVDYEEEGVVYVEHPGVHLADTASWRFGADEVFRVGERDGPRDA